MQEMGDSLYMIQQIFLGLVAVMEHIFL
jgi:hypothetical protein